MAPAAGAAVALGPVLGDALAEPVASPGEGEEAGDGDSDGDGETVGDAESGAGTATVPSRALRPAGCVQLSRTAVAGPGPPVVSASARSPAVKVTSPGRTPSPPGPDR